MKTRTSPGVVRKIVRTGSGLAELVRLWHALDGGQRASLLDFARALAAGRWPGDFPTPQVADAD